MTTIIQDNFSNGASVSLDMDKDAGELFVFHFQAEGKGCITRKYPLDSYHMHVAMATYDAACTVEMAALADI
ncbi:hypothetical protein [Pseudomonas phage Astolliot]|nr:hypothetical protein [Pseudomonas phage Astolliot]